MHTTQVPDRASDAAVQCRTSIRSPEPSPSISQVPFCGPGLSAVCEGRPARTTERDQAAPGHLRLDDRVSAGQVQVPALMGMAPVGVHYPHLRTRHGHVDDPPIRCPRRVTPCGVNTVGCVPSACTVKIAAPLPSSPAPRALGYGDGAGCRATRTPRARTSSVPQSHNDSCKPQRSRRQDAPRTLTG